MKKVMKFYIPQGTWPLKFEEYSSFFKRLGYVQGGKDSDFLLLPGGSDLGVRENRDAFERSALKEFQGRKVVGICRGFQLLGVESGARLESHLPDLDLIVHHGTQTSDWTGKSSWHKTRHDFLTNTRHHQGFLDLPGWDVLDSTEDSVIEAASLNAYLGVQWHPEKREMQGTRAEEWFSETLSQHLYK